MRDVPLQCNASQQWWQCSSGSSYLLGNRLANILIRSSLRAQPTDPSLSSNHWITIDDRKAPYGAVGVIDFKYGLLARHVAVYSKNTEALSLAEVEIYGKD